jgi:hypothetical protein
VPNLVLLVGGLVGIIAQLVRHPGV